MISDVVTVSHGYTSAYIHSQIGHNFPVVSTRVFPDFSGRKILLNGRQVKTVFGSHRTISKLSDDVPVEDFDETIINELETLVSDHDTFIRVKSKKHLTEITVDSLIYDKPVLEWEPSARYRSIPLIDDDEGTNNDVLNYGPHTGQYHTCCNSESNMKRAWHKRMLYGGKQSYGSAVLSLNSVDNFTLNKQHVKIPRLIVTCPAIQARLGIYRFLIDKFIPEYITPLEGGLDHITALENWIGPLKRYTLKTKEKMRNLLVKMMRGDYEASYHGQDDPMGLRVINIFQKCENYPEIKEPRAISACSEEAKCYLGGYLHAIDKHAIKTCPFFVKGLNSYAIDNKKTNLARRWSLFMGSDYSSYEGSQDYCWINMIEKTIYLKWLENYPEIQQHISEIYEKGHDIYYRKTFWGHLRGKRMSGDVQTSIGNGICNALIWKYVSYVSNVPIELLVEGDDAFICSDAELDVSIVHRLGFDCKIDGPSTNPDDICFLSRYMIDGNPFADIPKVMDKIGVVKSSHFAKCYKRNTNRSLREINDYAYTKAYCYLFMYSGCPVVDPACRAIMRCTQGRFRLELMDDYFAQRFEGLTLRIPNRPILDCVRKKVAELWPQYSLNSQYELERDFNMMKTLCNRILDVTEEAGSSEKNVEKEVKDWENKKEYSSVKKTIKENKSSYYIW